MISVENEIAFRSCSLSSTIIVRRRINTFFFLFCTHK